MEYGRGVRTSCRFVPADWRIQVSGTDTFLAVAPDLNVT